MKVKDDKWREVKVNRILSCIHRDKDLLVRPGVQCPALVPTIHKRHRQTWEHPEAGHEGDPRAGKPPLWEKTDAVESSNFEKSWLREDIIAAFQYLKGHLEKGDGSVFTGSPKKRTRGNEDKLHQERFSLNIGSEHLTVRTMNPWNNLPRNGIWLSSFHWGFSRWGCVCAGWSHLGSLWLDQVIFQGLFLPELFYYCFIWLCLSPSQGRFKMEFWPAIVEYNHAQLIYHAHLCW